MLRRSFFEPSGLEAGALNSLRGSECAVTGMLPPSYSDDRTTALATATMPRPREQRLAKALLNHEYYINVTKPKLEAKKLDIKRRKMQIGKRKVGSQLEFGGKTKVIKRRRERG